MRLRNIKGSRERIEGSALVVQDPKACRGHWREEMGASGPLHLEIGMGKGQFLCEMAARNPGIFYLGIEKYSSVLIRALEKTEEDPLPNLRFLRMDAEWIDEVFAEGEVDRIYLNFSDPWPKEKHAKRRLTSREFLARYDRILAPAGWVEFKTDNVPLFDFSLEEIEAAGWKILYQTRDLHHSPYVEGNVMTEYEEKFSSQGNAICKLCAVRGAAGKEGVS